MVTEWSVSLSLFHHSLVNKRKQFHKAGDTTVFKHLGVFSKANSAWTSHRISEISKIKWKEEYQNWNLPSSSEKALAPVLRILYNIKIFCCFDLEFY